MGFEFIKNVIFLLKGLNPVMKAIKIFLLPKGLISSKPIANLLYKELISKRTYLHKIEVTEKCDEHFKQ